MSHSPRQFERELRTELAGLGLAWKSLKPILPDWTESAFDSRSGIIELKTFLSRNAGLQILDGGNLAARELPAACFKTNMATSIDQVVAARSMATAAARLIATATTVDYTAAPSNPADFRSAALRITNNRWIDLPTLLEACWSCGVPVLYMPKLPVEGRKMEGMVTFVSGRPVIILTKRVPHPDWLLFILGHEFGHIASGHLQEDEGQAIVDDTVDAEGGDRDQQEKEANDYATRVLAPEGMEVLTLPRLPKAVPLAKMALSFGQLNGIAPGYVILNAVHNSRIHGKKPYALGQAALKALPSVTDSTAADCCKTALRKHIDISKLRDDSIEYLEKLDLL